MSNPGWKFPCFWLYTNDWLSSTAITMMTPAQEGAYIRLLCYAWNDPDCSIPDDDEVLASLSRLGEDWHKGASSVLRRVFVPTPELPGRLVNLKLLERRRAAIEGREKSSLGGRKAAANRKLKSIEPTDSPLGSPLQVDKFPSSSSSSSILNTNTNTPLPPKKSRSSPLPVRNAKLPREALELPDPPEEFSEFACDDFRKTWASWAEHRRETGNKLTKTTTERQLRKLYEMGLERAMAAIEHSITQGWTGIYEPDRPRSATDAKVQAGLNLPPISRNHL